MQCHHIYFAEVYVLSQYIFAHAKANTYYCVCVFMYASMYVYDYLYTCVCRQIPVCVFKYTLVHVYVYSYVCLYVFLNINILEAQHTWHGAWIGSLGLAWPPPHGLCCPVTLGEAPCPGRLHNAPRCPSTAQCPPSPITAPRSSSCPIILRKIALTPPLL